MALESSFNFIDDLVTSNPAAGDNISAGDDHLRGIKSAVKGSFTSLGSVAVTATAAELNIMDGITKTTAELNVASSSVLETAVATTSGTVKTFTGIPSWANEIIFMLDGVSLDASGGLIITIGDSGGLETTGYSSGIHTTDGTTSAVTNSTSGAIIAASINSTSVISGLLTLSLEDISNNTWSVAGLCFDSTLSAMSNTAGSKSLSGVLTQISITGTFGGNFDAGSINIKYKG